MQGEKKENYTTKKKSYGILLLIYVSYNYDKIAEDTGHFLVDKDLYQI